jgi:hypothetical protein
MSAIQGYPSNQKVPLGTGITNNFATIIPTDPYRSAIDSTRFAYRIAAIQTAGASTGIDSSSGDKLFWVENTSTAARAGDFVRFESGAAQYLEIPIVKVETNRFLLAINSGLVPAPSDTFYILRYATQRVGSDGSQLVSFSPTANAAGSYAEITNLTTVAQTFTVPANAVGFVIEALSDNTNNIRYKIGAAATTASGMRLEPGRSENFNNGPAANISVIAEGGTNQVVSVQWILSA